MPGRRKWSMDLILREQDVGYDSLQKLPAPPGMRKVAGLERKIESEGGKESSVVAGGGRGPSSRDALALAAKKRARAMAVATGPGKQIAMNAFMMYMSGSNLNIFSISIVSMAIMSPIKGMMNISNAFRAFEDPDGRVDLQMPKLLFLGLNMVWLCVGLYKMAMMRLLPTTSADWSGTVVWKELIETSSIPV